jgi:hypothetical protein
MKLCVRDHNRDKDIVHLREHKKWTYVAIAEKHNITKARARELYLRMMKDREKVSRQLGIGA